MPVIPKAFTYLEMRRPKDNVMKFWAMRFEPTTKGAKMALHVWWGRIATRGQDKVFDFYVTEGECLADARARAESKLREGYTPVTVCDWVPDFIRLADREPKVDRSFMSWKGDQDPLDARDYFPPVERKPDTPPSVLRKRSLIEEVADSVRTKRGVDLAKTRDRTVITIVAIATDRVIDFEE